MANVRDFEYITEIANQGSISKAAEVLFLSQPTLSKFLQRVEKEVGQPLFHRVEKRFILTPAGEIYVARSKSILELEYQMRQELSALAKMQSGRIRIGTTAGRSSFVIQQVLPVFREMYPHIRLIVSSWGNLRLMKMMQNNEIDFAIVTYSKGFDLFNITNIGEDELVLVAPNGSPLKQYAVSRAGSRFPVIPVEHWKDQPFVLPLPPSSSHSLVTHYWEKMQVTPNVIMEVQDIRTIVDAVQNRIGISMFISVPGNEKSEVCYYSLEGDHVPKQQACIVTHRDAYYSKAQNALMELIRDMYRYPDNKE